MSALRAIFVGLWRAIESPGLVIWLWLVNFAIALPAGVVMSETIRSSIGSSLVHKELATGFDMGWYGEFRQEAAGLERTFTPTVVGAGAFYNNVEGWLFGGLFQQFPGVVGLGVVYALVWALFIGGILDRFSKSEGFFGLSRFLSSGGRFFFRFLRLVVLAGAAYYLVYRFAGWLFRRIDYWARDVTVEGTVLMYVLLGTAVVVFLLTLVNMAFDYAKIATFVEDRSSMVLAALRGFLFVLSHPGKTFGLCYGLGVLAIVLLGLYSLVAPGAGQSTMTGVVLAFVIGQAYLVAKLVVRLAFYGGQLALYEGVTRAEASASEVPPDASPVELETKESPESQE